MRLAGLGLLLAACGSFGSRSAELTSPGANSVTEGTARIHQGDTVSIGSMFGCLVRPGSITIENIEPIHAIGLRVTGWALRPNPFWKPAPPNLAHLGGQIGIARTSLARLAFPSGRKVDAQCGQHGEGYEFAVQVEKTTSGEAGASGWVVTYKTGDETRKFGFPIAVKLCNERVSWSKQCNALHV